MIRIELMRNDPIVLNEGTSIRIDGVQRHLFRLLILNEGRAVNNESIAQLTDAEPATAPSKIRYLKQDLGKLAHLIRNQPGTGYSINLEGCYVDAITFRREVQNSLKRKLDPLSDMLELDEALHEVNHLESLMNMWQANPAVGLPAEEGLERKFEDLYENISNRITCTRLMTKQYEQIKTAISELEIVVQSDEADELSWQLLLLAYNSIGSEKRVSNTWERISQIYKSNIPQRLESTMHNIYHVEGYQNPFCETKNGYMNGQNSALSNAKSNSDELSVETICRVLGIATTSHLKLANSQLEPEACILRTQRRLWFSGVLASKWVTDAAVRSEFDKLLGRLDREGGEARFMMINPTGTGYKRLHELRQGQISTESIEPIRRLAAVHSSLQVRFFENLPSFRIVIIDDDVVSFSPYRLGADAYLAADRGWKAPHVVLDPMAPYPLAEAFELLFRETWDNAMPIENII